MIYIKKKSSAPKIFRDLEYEFKYYDNVPEKKEMRTLLIKEQGYLCAYCMRRIEPEKSTIEHYIPRSKEPKKSLNYHNLLAVCCGNLGCDQTCDKNRGNTDIFINPTIPNHINMISYNKATGEILSSDYNYKLDLNITLNLNHKLFQKNRKAALQAFLNTLIKKHPTSNWKKEGLRKILNTYETAEKKDEYIGIVIWYLRKRVGNL